MLLEFEKLDELICGAEDIVWVKKMICPRRFTTAQSSAYSRLRCADFYKKTFATAGVRMACVTNSKTLSLRWRTEYGSGRLYGYFDVVENGVLIANFGAEESGSGEFSINLSPGEKLLEIYFPWSKEGMLGDVTLDDGAYAHPVKRSGTLMCYGDSITHGYDARYPSLSYANRLARLLDSDLYNKAIGGDTFFPELLDCGEPITPDVVTVAYGTNDWSTLSRVEATTRCRAFFAKLAYMYPEAKIFAITPIWRGDAERETKFGAPISQVELMIRSACAELENVRVIPGWNLTPHLPEFFWDKRLHPNDLGFAEYATNLYGAMKPYL